MIDFRNKCGRMKLTLKSENAVDLSMKIAKAFDDICTEEDEQ